VITLQVNGKEVELERPTPLLVYLETLGVNPRAVAVEHNGTIIERVAYQSVTLRGGDTVEIVRMVGGGISRGSTRGSTRGLEARRKPPGALAALPGPEFSGSPAVP
jgi:sulfur carrier protein